MPFKEALFWFSLTVFGTGLYFTVEKENVRLPYAIVLLVVGLAGIVYPVLRHHYPEKQLPAIRGWVLLLAMTWAALGYDMYARHRQQPTIIEKPVEKIVPGDCPKSDNPPAAGRDKKPKQSAGTKVPAVTEAAPKSQPPSQSCPNGICIGGENSGNPTVNNFGPQIPDVTWSSEKPSHPNAKESEVCVNISINRTFMDPKFAVICDRPCKAVWGDSRSPHGGVFQSDRGGIPDYPGVAAFSINSPNPMPVDNTYMACVESMDANPAHVVAVKTLTIKPK